MTRRKLITAVVVGAVALGLVYGLKGLAADGASATAPTQESQVVTARSVTLPEPVAITAHPTSEQLRAILLDVQGSLCRDISRAAQVLIKTGMLTQAMPLVIEATGLQPAEMQQRESAVCRRDTSTMTIEQIHANNSMAVWLLGVQVSAMSQVLPQP